MRNRMKFWMVFLMGALLVGGCTGENEGESAETEAATSETAESSEELPFKVEVETKDPVDEYAETEAGKGTFDFTLTDQYEKKRSFTDFRGKAVLVTSIFTRCPDPQMCSKITSKTAAVQRLLEKSGVSDKVQILSISMDPAYDTPKVLRDYQELYEIDGANYAFLTGTEKEVDAVLEDIRFFYDPKGAEEGNIVHETKVMLFGTDGKLQKIFKGTRRWQPEDVVEAVERTLAVETD